MQPDDEPASSDDSCDIVIIGAGPAGITAGIEAKRRGYTYRVLEQSRPLNTIVNYPAGKHVYAEPASMKTLGPLEFEDSSKEELLENWGEKAAEVDIETGKNVEHIHKHGDMFRVELVDGETISCRRVILAIGRMGNPRKLNVRGEELPCVYSAMLNPGKYRDKRIVVVGGGNSAVEAVLALKDANLVTLVHRRETFDRISKINRSMLEQAERNGEITIIRSSRIVEFRPGEADVQVDDGVRTVTRDVAFVLIGADPPTSFLKRLGVSFEGEWSLGRIPHFAWVFTIVYVIYGIKFGLWPFKTLYGTLMSANVDPGMLYGIVYSALITFFGLKALKKYRDDPFQQKRYGFLIGAQWLVYFILPWALYYVGYSEWWRSWGVSLTYPLGYYGLWDSAEKLFSGSVLPWTIATLFAFLVFMPVFSAFHGKRFCAWFCPCGALADTVGDAWRHKAPRGVRARRVEFASTIILVITVIASIFIIGDYRRFLAPDSVKSTYKLIVDIGLASIIAITLYPFSGGRIWCRFFCPLAKWMELWGRWTGGKLAIVPNDECISCGECTRYCQMGIDVRGFAQREQPLSNETTCCVFCGICVTVCPVDVLSVERR
jgi:thioredoxin reductase/Pyruvate/2-oxoacid:ferredoxin oxidoreductase delta subunit